MIYKDISKIQNEISRYIDNKITPEYLLEKEEIKKEVIDALKKVLK